MFKLNQSETYVWPVEFSLPMSGGKHEKQTFDVVFKRITQKRLKAYLDGVGEEADKLNDETFCRETVAGFKGIVDANGEEVPFSETSFEELLNVPGVAKAIVLAYVASVSGAKVKN